LRKADGGCAHLCFSNVDTKSKRNLGNGAPLSSVVIFAILEPPSCPPTHSESGDVWPNQCPIIPFWPTPTSPSTAHVDCATAERQSAESCTECRVLRNLETACQRGGVMGVGYSVAARWRWRRFTPNRGYRRGPPSLFVCALCRLREGPNTCGVTSSANRVAGASLISFRRDLAILIEGSAMGTQATSDEDGIL
jgi:hypothetical protein